MEPKRRARNVAQPTGRDIRISDRDVRLLATLERNGPLPTRLAFEAWRGHESRSFGPFQDRIGTLFHEQKSGGALLVRPPELNPRYAWKCEPTWMDVSAHGRLLLAEKQLLSRYSASRKDPLHHRAMGACIATSFELLAPQYKIRVHGRNAIFGHASCPEETRLSRNPLVVALSEGNLEPDDLIGLEYINEGYSFFAREDDRGTESFRRTDTKQTSLEAKIRRYLHILEDRIYHRQWGVPNLRVLIATTQRGRIDTMLRYLKDKSFGDCFLFKALPNFGVDWRAPRALLGEVFSPWQSINGPIDISRP